MTPQKKLIASKEPKANGVDTVSFKKIGERHNFAEAYSGLEKKLESVILELISN